MPTRFLTRARLRRDASASAIRELLIPRGDAERTLAGHRVVWTLFGDDADRRRDFLWREAEPGLFYLLSERPPADPHALFELGEPKPFAPALRAGDRLHFILRANATVARRQDGSTGRGKPCDVVMDALYRIPKNARADQRRHLVVTAGGKWLSKQGVKAGFRLCGGSRDRRDEDDPTSLLTMASYRTLRLDRPGKAARIGILDLEGNLEVQNPEAFVGAVATGFGRAKAFGCGLMLVRRA
jgi:CRISPR system Cascade subunit CasE